MNPSGVPLYNLVTKKMEPQFYRAGLVDMADGDVLCWFCSTPNFGRHL